MNKKLFPGCKQKIFNLIGIKYGQLKVLDFTKVDKNGFTYWDCLCECGNRKIINGNSLRKNKTKSCGCLERQKRLNLMIGKKFGKLTVLSFLRKGNGFCLVWQCKCDCGKLVERATDVLTRGNNSNCGCVRPKVVYKPYFGIHESYLSEVKKGAKNREIEYNVDKKYLWDLFLNQNEVCKLSGIKLYFPPFYKRNRKIMQSASLDRVDSTKSYAEGNLQWIHKNINVSKNNLCNKDYISWCRLISNKHFNCNFEISEEFIKSNQPLDKSNKSGKYDYKEISNQWFCEQINRAKSKNISFNLKIQDIWNLFVNQQRRCAISNLILNFSHISNRTSLFTVSIDRINSNLDYSVENIQLVHKRINTMKWNFEQRHFLDMVHRVAIFGEC